LTAANKLIGTVRRVEIDALPTILTVGVSVFDETTTVTDAMALPPKKLISFNVSVRSPGSNNDLSSVIKFPVVVPYPHSSNKRSLIGLSKNASPDACHCTSAHGLPPFPADRVGSIDKAVDIEGIGLIGLSGARMVTEDESGFKS